MVDNKAMVFTFGRSGFFGYAGGAPASSNSLMWWSTFETDSLPSKTNLDIEEIKTSLRERHMKWADPVVQDIVSKAEVQSIYPTWVLPDLPHWGQNNIVLVGDAAHALSPTTGQGASQALEDAQTLSYLLRETLSQAYQSGSPLETTEERGAVSQALKLFYDIRQPRVAAIAERGKKMDRGKVNMSVVEEYVMYCFLWATTHFPFIGESYIWEPAPLLGLDMLTTWIEGKLLLGDVNASLYGWSAKLEVEKVLSRKDTTPLASTS